MRSRIQMLFCAGTILATAAGVARAETLYSDPGAFAAAAPGLATVNFSGISVPASPGFVNYPTSLTINGVTFGRGPNGDDNLLFVVPPQAYGFAVNAFSAQSMGDSPDSVNDLLISFASPQTSVGFDIITANVPVTITLSDGTTETIANPTSAPGTTFFGVTGAAGITSIDISTPSDLDAGSIFTNVTDVFFTPSASAVPEPSSLALLATGLIGVGGTLRKKLARA